MSLQHGRRAGDTDKYTVQIAPHNKEASNLDNKILKLSNCYGTCVYPMTNFSPYLSTKANGNNKEFLLLICEMNFLSH